MRSGATVPLHPVDGPIRVKPGELLPKDSHLRKIHILQLQVCGGVGGRRRRGEERREGDSGSSHLGIFEGNGVWVGSGMGMWVWRDVGRSFVS